MCHTRICFTVHPGVKVGILVLHVSSLLTVSDKSAQYFSSTIIALVLLFWKWMFWRNNTRQNRNICGLEVPTAYCLHAVCVNCSDWVLQKRERLHALRCQRSSQSFSPSVFSLILWGPLYHISYHRRFFSVMFTHPCMQIHTCTYTFLWEQLAAFKLLVRFLPSCSVALFCCSP